MWTLYRADDTRAAHWISPKAFPILSLPCNLLSPVPTIPICSDAVHQTTLWMSLGWFRCGRGCTPSGFHLCIPGLLGVPWIQRYFPRIIIAYMCGVGTTCMNLPVGLRMCLHQEKPARKGGKKSKHASPVKASFYFTVPHHSPLKHDL